MISLRRSCKLCADKETCAFKKRVEAFDKLIETKAIVEDPPFTHKLKDYSPFANKGLELSLHCKYRRSK